MKNRLNVFVLYISVLHLHVNLHVNSMCGLNKCVCLDIRLVTKYIDLLSASKKAIEHKNINNKSQLKLYVWES